MASQELEEKGRDFEKSVEERSTDDWAPIIAENIGPTKAVSLLLAIIISPVPVDRVTRYYKDDYLMTKLHESCKNCRPQRNYTMLRMPQNEGLLKSKKLLFDLLA